MNIINLRNTKENNMKMDVTRGHMQDTFLWPVVLENNLKYKFLSLV